MDEEQEWGPSNAMALEVVRRLGPPRQASSIL
jgi:hypothetical protein